MSMILIKTVPRLSAFTMWPLATSTKTLVDSHSMTKSSAYGVMWLEQPESMSHWVMRECLAFLVEVLGANLDFLLVRAIEAFSFFPHCGVGLLEGILIGLLEKVTE